MKKAKDEGGKCYCALYELTDEELISNLIDAKDNVEIILSNADTSESTTDEEGTKHSKKILDGENAATRDRLKGKGIVVHDRFVPGGHIGHNKFVIYENGSGKRESVLTGSTNWTPTGLCTQSNNALIIESENTAENYYKYWLRLKEDTENNESQQSEELRNSDNVVNPVKINGFKADYWFSPNTKAKSKPKNEPDFDLDNDPHAPSDIKELFNQIGGAQKSILFLVFQPGSPSILDKILEVQKKNSSIFVRGAATDAKAVENYNMELYHGDSDTPDLYDVVAASNIKDDFAYWEKELLSAGHAIIHDKIIVIDAFTDNCVVITGSHNLGYKASYSNDENLCIIYGNKKLSSAYAAHVMDVYEHYRWRYILLNKGKDASGDFKAYNGLITTDKWQDKYFKAGADTKSASPLRKDLTFFE